MADADLALYQAKDQPGGGAACSSSEWKRRVVAAPRSNVHSSSQASLTDSVWCSSRFSIRDRDGPAHEALARWSDPELGSVPPSEFVPIAEQLVSY